MRVIRGLAALVVLLSGLFAVPVFLVVLVGNPLPGDLDWERLVGGLTRPDDGSILVGFVTVVAWLAWAVFAASVVVETIAVLSRQRVRIRLPGLMASQRLASGLVVAVVALVVVTPQLGHASPAGATTAPSRDEAAPTAATTPTIVEKVTSAEQEHVPAAAPQAVGIRHTVERGDDLWSLAERFYGEGREWRKIAAANPGVLTGGPDRLVPGWRLLIPDVEHSPAGRTVVVETGDTLSSIADRLWSDADRWPEVYEANRFQLDDPDELPVGLTLVLPARSLDKPKDVASGRTSAAESRIRAETGAGADGPVAEESGSTEREPDALPRPRADGPAAPRHGAPSAPTTVTPSTRGTAAPDPADDLSPSGALTAVDPVVAGLAGVGGLLAAAVISAVGLRRRAQLQVRPVGRRIRQPSPAAQLAEAHLGQRQQPMGLRTLDLATRAIAAYCHRTGAELPAVLTASVHPDSIDLELGAPCPDAPPGFRADGSRWRLLASDVDRLRSIPGLSDAVRPYPALVTLGVTGQGGQVVADLEQLRLTSVEAAAGEPAEAVLSAIALELSCSPWAEELEVVVIGACERLPDALGRHNVTRADELGPVLDRLSRRAEAQRSHLAGGSLAAKRIDPDLADPWMPTVLVVDGPLSADEQRRLRALVLSEPPVSIAAVGVNLTTAPCRVVLSGAGADLVARIEPYDIVVAPQLLTPPAEAAVIDLVEATGRSDTTPAPWWFDGESSTEPEPPDNVTYLGRRFGGWVGTRSEDADNEEREGGAMNRQTTRATTAVSHPTLQLLGPVELDGAAGAPPPRAAKQCLEYCAWILEHPGTTAQAMGAALAVAEGTRRSNMSRLRSWLGADDVDQPYLPDAYSGRIVLHPAVSSDWQRLQILTGRGVNRTSSSGLEAALQLVRGAPLADAAPGQWHWAEGLRTDMISVIRDIGVELTDRALVDSDIELARWAAARALAAAPGDELLIVARIKTEHRAGNDPEVERLTLQLAAHARALEVDLRPETVDVLQQMMEGRVRARLA
ncbi:MAG TPA: LysM peptidoglycan-binding domain-containing protein [Microlunatus sp.]|nr:LysM peptidoglycan-binding domain-containing protein [Microlunatus sp.]